MDVLRFLTHKLRSQSLNEVQPFQPKEEEEEHDSGTESDTENAELEEAERISELEKNGVHTQASTIMSTSTSPFSELDSDSNSAPHPFEYDFNFHKLPPRELTNTPDLIAKNFTERRKATRTPHSLSSSSEFEANSSEEELSVINSREFQPEKRKWSQMHRRSYGDSSGSSDDEVKDLFTPQPLLFSSTPPKGVGLPHFAQSTSTQLFLAKVAPIQKYTSSSSSSSPRKRHRHMAPSEESCDSSESVITRRPCLDFEKMQQKTLGRKHYSHNYSRARVVKIRSITNSSNRPPKFLYDPSVFDFRSISTAFNPLTPVEEPSCAF